MGNFELADTTLRRITHAAAAPNAGALVMRCWHSLKKSGYNSGTAHSLLMISLDIADKEIDAMLEGVGRR